MQNSSRRGTVSRSAFGNELLHPPNSNRNLYFTVGSLRYILSVCQVPRDKTECTSPCNLSTIVPFGGHGFCVIDSTLDNTRAGGKWASYRAITPANGKATLIGYGDLIYHDWIESSEFIPTPKDWRLPTGYMCFGRGPIRFWHMQVLPRWQCSDHAPGIRKSPILPFAYKSEQTDFSLCFLDHRYTGSRSPGRGVPKVCDARHSLGELWRMVGVGHFLEPTTLRMCRKF
jgi:hypothetical protein